jgi:superfamily II DNA or RNA helicase
VADSASFGLAGAGSGDTVRARRALWRIDSVRHEPQASVVALQPDSSLGIGGLERIGRTLIAPFDNIAPVTARSRLAPVSRRRAIHRLATLVTASAPFDLPTSAATAPARLLPFQLEPLLALRTGRAARVLIADHVGLGKTIQLPSHVNPWASSPVIVASIDFVKQPEVRHGLRHQIWDLFIVDEAHLLTPGSDRLAAADAIARQSARVVLLTATPHDGREAGFRALCDLGRVGSADVIAIFRRTRAASGAGHRRVFRRLAVLPTAAERRVHALLARYATRVWSDRSPHDRGPARLAMTVLFKRAASSAASLAQSLERRRTLLQLATLETAEPTQPSLPLAMVDSVAADDNDDAPDTVLAAPGLEPARERTWLNLLIHAAQAATRDEAKVRVLVRLVRRLREPVIVFTEYRDTLTRLEPVLRAVAPTVTIHGGRTPEARREALDAFSIGDARVLLATDAASVGLNLQARCRFVVHVELPWSPTRLEQRVGRVDRLGQTRTVHALHLVADADVEAAIEARLIERARHIHAALDNVSDDGLEPDEARDEGGAAERAVDPVSWLGAAIRAAPDGTAGPGADADDPSRSPADRHRDLAAGVVRLRLRRDAERVVGALELRRRLDRHIRARSVCADAMPPPDTALTTRRRRRERAFVAQLARSFRRHGTLPRGEIHVYRTRVAHICGSLVEHTLTALAVRRDATDSPHTASQEFVARQVEARCRELTVEVEHADALVRVRRREALARVRSQSARVQLTLFDDRSPGGDETPVAEGMWPRDADGDGDDELRGTSRLAAVLRVD